MSQSVRSLVLLLVAAWLVGAPAPSLAINDAEAVFSADNPAPVADGDRADEIIALLLDLDLRRQAITEQIQAGERALADLAVEMAEIRRKVRAGRADIDRQRVEAGKRVAVLARLQPIDWLDILLGSDSFADFVGRWDTAQQLHARDVALLQDLQAARQRQQAYLASLAARYERTELQQLALRALALEAERTAAELEAELAKLADERQSYEALLAELEAEWQQALPGLQGAVARLIALEHNFLDVQHELSFSLIPFGARVTVEAQALEAYLAAGGHSGWGIGLDRGVLTLASADGRVSVGGPLHGDGDALVWSIHDVTFAGVAIPLERQSAWIERSEVRLRPADLPLPYTVDRVTAEGGMLILVLR